MRSTAKRSEWSSGNKTIHMKLHCMSAQNNLIDDWAPLKLPKMRLVVKALRQLGLVLWQNFKIENCRRGAVATYALYTDLRYINISKEFKIKYWSLRIEVTRSVIFTILNFIFPMTRTFYSDIGNKTYMTSITALLNSWCLF